MAWSHCVVGIVFPELSSVSAHRASQEMQITEQGGLAPREVSIPPGEAGPAQCRPLATAEGGRPSGGGSQI